jgi:hypothetical protein
MSQTLFDVTPDWQKVWKAANMPEYDQGDLEPFQSLVVYFATLRDREAFAKLVDRPDLTSKTPYIWYPKVERIKHDYQTGAKVQPNKYPIYVISKGRHEYNVTARNLEALGIDYKLVVEPQEFQAYSQAIDPSKILQLPFQNLGKGSIPARNWCWDNSKQAGAKRHWILDDNIQGFYKLNNNQKPKMTTENPFIFMERFTDAHKNVGISGPNYEFFTQRRSAMPPYYKNTRVYSCLLIRNDLPFRWRGRYNEDTDLCLRVLKSGLCTVLFNFIQAKKIPTMTMKGGNTDELYQEDGRLKMAESLVAQHPTLVKITRKWGRWQHHVNYKPFARTALMPR